MKLGIWQVLLIVAGLFLLWKVVLPKVAPGLAAKLP